MANLERRDLVGVVRDVIDRGTPFLGVCMGLQALLTLSLEGGEHRCLDVIPGVVKRFPPGRSIPHMGWNQLQFRRRPPLFAGVEDGAHFYFVHSYYVAPRDAAWVATETDYATQFCSSVWRDQLFAVQFHPEKSQSAGLRLLKNFAALS